MEESITLETPAPNKAKRKSKNGKWREIEAIKEKSRLAKELGAYDFNFDFSDEDK
ncbi:DUF3545 family protein [Opacimonas viscosa]|uniref:DUF3545 family protein n=1 Tax=Opacimonas viscosa TaxID=2961944 RepID=A0AA42BKM1_9ALTE|nr:DUF3545 family protein [Opacimonas viscosa]MCP3427928.1 DUF3545 family protein [Opacimonas viscosa]